MVCVFASCKACTFCSLPVRYSYPRARRVGLLLCSPERYTAPDAASAVALLPCVHRSQKVEPGPRWLEPTRLHILLPVVCCLYRLIASGSPFPVAYEPSLRSSFGVAEKRCCCCEAGRLIDRTIIDRVVEMVRAPPNRMASRHKDSEAQPMIAELHTWLKDVPKNWSNRGIEETTYDSVRGCPAASPSACDLLNIRQQQYTRRKGFCL